jgi:hypothetical protein
MLLTLGHILAYNMDNTIFNFSLLSSEGEVKTPCFLQVW